MAKFIKSIFTPERSKERFEEEMEGEADAPHLNDRRKLSMSRSGRLKQSVKRRQQLSVEVYGGGDMQTSEKPKSMEYHVHTPVCSSSTAQEPQFDRTTGSVETATQPENRSDNTSKSPDEEIDRAFENIDKS